MSFILGCLFYLQFGFFFKVEIFPFLWSWCARVELPTVNLVKQDIFINLEMSCFSKVLYYIINSFVTTEGVEDAQVIIIRSFLFV